MRQEKALILYHKLDMYPITLMLALNQAGINEATHLCELPATGSAATWGLYDKEIGNGILVASDRLTADDDILVHEAVHVFQRICTVIGDEHPGHEIEAYHIQHIASLLIFMRNQMVGRVKKSA